jgi:hypothetical protein
MQNDFKDSLNTNDISKIIWYSLFFICEHFWLPDKFSGIGFAIVIARKF